MEDDDRGWDCVLDCSALVADGTVGVTKKKGRLLLAEGEGDDACGGGMTVSLPATGDAVGAVSGSPDPGPVVATVGEPVVPP